MHKHPLNYRLSCKKTLQKAFIYRIIKAIYKIKKLYNC